MALPKKGTRIIDVEGVLYLYHSRFSYDTGNRWTVVQKKDTAGQILCLDPFSIPFGPAGVRKAIEFALAHGWAPEAKGKPLKLRYNGDNFDGELFTILPPGTTLMDTATDEASYIRNAQEA